MLIRRPAGGFSLMELVVTIVILGIIGGLLGGFILPAVLAHQAQVQRAALVDETEAALRRMGRDIRGALPNSVRVTDPATGAAFAIEMIPALDGARYCVAGLANCAGAAQVLDFSAPDTAFDVLGLFRNSAFVTAASAGTATTGATAYRLVINNSGNEVYSGTPTVVMTPTTTTMTLTTSGGRHHLALSAGFQFPSSSSRQRVFVVQAAAGTEGPISYLCTAGAGGTGTLMRYSGYTVVPTDPQPTTAAELTGKGALAVLITNSVSFCRAWSSTGNIQTKGLVSLSLSLERATETVGLMHQVQLDNSQ